MFMFQRPFVLSYFIGICPPSTAYRLWHDDQKKALSVVIWFSTNSLYTETRCLTIRLLLFNFSFPPDDFSLVSSIPWFLSPVLSTKDDAIVPPTPSELGSSSFDTSSASFPLSDAPHGSWSHRFYSSADKLLCNFLFCRAYSSSSCLAWSSSGCLSSCCSWFSGHFI